MIFVRFFMTFGEWCFSFVLNSFKYFWIILSRFESLWIALSFESLWALNRFESLWIALNSFESLWIDLICVDSLWITFYCFDSLWIAFYCFALRIVLNIFGSSSLAVMDHFWSCSSKPYLKVRSGKITFWHLSRALKDEGVCFPRFCQLKCCWCW